jgi:hypothetical protein
MHAVTLGQRPDRQALPVAVPADLLEQLHGLLEEARGALEQRFSRQAAGFAGMGVLLCISAVMLAFVPYPRYAAEPATVSLRDQVATSASLLRRSRRFVAMLAVAYDLPIEPGGEQRGDGVAEHRALRAADQRRVTNSPMVGMKTKTKVAATPRGIP